MTERVNTFAALNDLVGRLEDEQAAIDLNGLADGVRAAMVDEVIEFEIPPKERHHEIRAYQTSKKCPYCNGEGSFTMANRALRLCGVCAGRKTIAHVPPDAVSVPLCDKGRDADNPDEEFTMSYSRAVRDWVVYPVTRKEEMDVWDDQMSRAVNAQGEFLSSFETRNHLPLWADIFNLHYEELRFRFPTRSMNPADKKPAEQFVYSAENNPAQPMKSIQLV